MSIKRKLFVLSVAFLVFGVSAALAGPIKRVDRGASNNGLADDFTACSNPLHPQNCGNFSATTTTVDGLTVYQYVTNTGDFGTPGIVVISDVFQIPGTIAAGSVLTINVTDANQSFGVFACDNGSGPAVSAGTQNPGPCTVGNKDLVGDSNDLLNLFTESDSGNTATLTFLGAGPGSWTFFTDANGFASYSLNGTTTPTPEPGSASLLLAGALAAGLVALKARR